MTPKSKRAKDQVKVLNKPQHTVDATADSKDKLTLEPSEATCPIVRETL